MRNLTANVPIVPGFLIIDSCACLSRMQGLQTGLKTLVGEVANEEKRKREVMRNLATTLTPVYPAYKPLD